MTTQPTWSDVPPSEVEQWYWFRWQGGDPYPGLFLGNWDDGDEFGPRVLSAEETVKLTAEVERLRQTLREYCDDDEVSSGFGSGCYSSRQIDEIRKRHGLDTESEGS